MNLRVVILLLVGVQRWSLHLLNGSSFRLRLRFPYPCQRTERSSTQTNAATEMKNNVKLSYSDRQLRILNSSLNMSLTTPISCSLCVHVLTELFFCAWIHVESFTAIQFLAHCHSFHFLMLASDWCSTFHLCWCNIHMIYAATCHAGMNTCCLDYGMHRPFWRNVEH